MNTIDEIRSFLVNNFLFGDNSELQDETSFPESGIIDSSGILELITFLEETFRIEVNDDELLPENLDSLKNIEAFLSRKVKDEPIARRAH